MQKHYPTDSRTTLFITDHKHANHNQVVDEIQDGFDIIAPTIFSWIDNVEGSNI
jgi:hypothetical protein